MAETFYQSTNKFKNKKIQNKRKTGKEDAQIKLLFYIILQMYNSIFVM